MATKLYLRDTINHKLNVAGLFDLSTSPGNSLTTGVVNTAASGTDIQWTKTAGGVVLEWVSPPLAAGFTLATTDTITFNIWALESSMSANAGGRVRLSRIARYGDSTLSLAGGPWNDGVEFGTAAAAMNWTGTVTSNVTFNEDDRIRVRFYITNVGTMGGGFTCTLDYNGGNGSAVDGDSWIQLTNNVTFKTDTPPYDVVKPGTPPQIGAQVIAGHPIAPDIAWFAAHGNYAPDSRAPEYRRGRHGTVKTGDNYGAGGSNDQTSILKVGNGIWLRARSDHIEFPATDQFHKSGSSLGAMTLVIGARRLSSAAVTFQNWFQAGGSGVNRFQVMYGAFAPDGLRFDFGDVAQLFYNSGLSDGAAGDSVWTFSAGSRGMEIWRDGLKVASNSNTDTIAPTSDKIVIGASSGEAADNAIFGFAYVYFRQLTPAEIVQVSRAPF